MNFYIKDKKTGEVHKAWKLIKSDNGEISAWANTRYGRIVIGDEFEFAEHESDRNSKDQKKTKKGPEKG
jgi:hypothetical protein